MVDKSTLRLRPERCAAGFRYELDASALPHVTGSGVAMTIDAQAVAALLEVSPKVSMLLQKRLTLAQEQFAERVQEAVKKRGEALMAQPASPWELWHEWYRYSVDAAQRSVLMLDTLRQRGNNLLEHQRAGLPPLLNFDYEMVLDARKFARPVNYALVRIVPPAGIVVDEGRRPYVIIDPRAGHGPGIGGFKDDSQVGVALRDGHPVYFVIFFPEPEAGQTLPDVCAAEAEFVRKVRELHPDSPKPAIVGNCQGGWAAMMLASSNADDTGPIVINGAPMSYWGGAWNEGAGDNPMRYAGGLLGGSWLASLVADLSNGKFDGAWLVQNFENLHPANTFWDKYYHVYANVDTEPPRFLEFERWWGGFYLLNREEIEWIVQNLFVGNKLCRQGRLCRGAGAHRLPAAAQGAAPAAAVAADASRADRGLPGAAAGHDAGGAAPRARPAGDHRRFRARARRGDPPAIAGQAGGPGAAADADGAALQRSAGAGYA
jgi:hypothetical protein